MIKNSDTYCAHDRREYDNAPLHRRELDPNPLIQFHAWLSRAVDAGVPDPNTMGLATVAEDGQPSVRMVLLKHADPAGFVFFTNYLSRKGRELSQNPYAALVFYWSELSRQIRVAGHVEKLPPEESDAYFNSRPERSRISACVSPQSQIVASRNELEERFDKFSKERAGNPITRPDNWGGYRLIPSEIEFWQGRRDRLHDRFVYLPAEDGTWTINSLAP